MDRSALGMVANPEIPQAAAATAAEDTLHTRTVAGILQSLPIESIRRSLREPQSPWVMSSFLDAGSDGRQLSRSLRSRGAVALLTHLGVQTRWRRVWSVGFRIGGVYTCRKESRRTWSPLQVGQSKAQHVLNDVGSCLQGSFLAIVFDPFFHPPHTDTASTLISRSLRAWVKSCPPVHCAQFRSELLTAKLRALI